VKVSLLLAAPARFSKPAKLVPATAPAPAPVIDQLESAPGPWSVSLGPPAEIDVTFLKVIAPIPPPATVPVPSPAIVQSDATGELATVIDGPS
jgi:hypothetical protein